MIDFESEASVSKGRLVQVGSVRKRLIFIGLMLIMVSVIGVTMIYLRKQAEEKLAERKATKARIERLIAEEEERTVSISDYRAYVQTKSYIEEIAREVLGLVYKDEIIFKPVTELAPKGDEPIGAPK